ncbi:MAG: PLP-dependent transferase, partial [Acetatifactor sp.]|nr:PLP-dependent transferase [Acetatifactor sp.]
MERHDKNAKAVVEWLRTHEKVKKLYYAGIGGMISFELDSVETVKHLLEGVNMIMFAESLGGTETLVTYPLTQTHESIPEEIRQKLGINERFVRISIGIEDVRDIIADLAQALA